MRQSTEQPQKAKKEKLRGSFLLKLALFCMAAAVLFSIVQRQVQISEKRQQLVELQAQLETQNQKNQELRRSLDDETGLGAYAEHRARVDLDYARPGEKVFIDMGGE